jgi:hypothetical protein
MTLWVKDDNVTLGTLEIGRGSIRWWKNQAGRRSGLLRAHVEARIVRLGPRAWPFSLSYSLSLRMDCPTM